MQSDCQEGLLAQALFQSLCGPGLGEQFLAQVKTVPRNSLTIYVHADA